MLTVESQKKKKKPKITYLERKCCVAKESKNFKKIKEAEKNICPNSTNIHKLAPQINDKNNCTLTEKLIRDTNRNFTKRNDGFTNPGKS